MTANSEAVRSGIRAEIVTIAWMILEGAVAVIAGIRAHSVLVTAFGIDSGIELISGCVLLWRIRNESASNAESIERRAANVSGVLLVLLCLYIIVSSVIGLLHKVDPEQTIPGLAVAAAAVALMPLLANWKRRVNRELQSAALRADIAETDACGWMAAIVVGGVLLNRFLHVWWVEYVATAGLLLWIAYEAKETFEAARGESCEE